jgi:hypothetical protein
MNLECSFAPKADARIPRAMKYTQFHLRSPETMYFTGHIFRGANRLLPRQSCLGSPDPVDPRGNRTLDVTRGRPRRGSDANLATALNGDGKVSNAFVRNRRVDAGRVDAILPQREKDLEAHRTTQ